MITRYVIIGCGVAGTTAAETIRALDREGAITMVTEEDLPFYYRIRLPELLAGEIDEQRLLAHQPEWYTEKAITLLTATRIITGDPDARTLITDDGRTLAYDKLLIATGSHAFVPPMAGADRDGVFTLRDIEDVRAIKTHAAKAGRAVLIGGGLLGLETGHALRKLGKEVTVVEFLDRLLPRQLDTAGAARLQRIMEERLGFAFRLGARTREIAGDRMVTGVALASGETLPADLVIISAGVRANLDLAVSLGLDYDKGIKVNNRMATSRPAIHAAGDVAEVDGQPPYGIWPAALQQGKVAGTVMAGGEAAYTGTTMANKLKVVGIDLAAAGDIDADNRFRSRISATAEGYRKIVIDRNRVIGCILLGDTRDYARLTKAIAEQTELEQLDPALLGQALG